MKRKHSRLLADATALLGGLIYPLAFAPFALRPLWLLAFAALFFSVVFIDSTPKRALWRGYLWGLGAFGVGVSWVYYSMHDYGGAAPLAAGLFTLVFVAYLALFPAFAMYCWRRFAYHAKSAPQLQALALALAMIVFEWLRTWLLSGFPWLLSGHALLDTPLAALFPLIGSMAASALLLWSLASLLFIIKAFRGYAFAIWLGLSAGCFALCLYLPSLKNNQDLPQIDVAVVQGNVPQQLKLDPKYLRNSLNMYYQLSRTVFDSDLIIWPETAVPTMQKYVQPFLERMARETQSGKVALLTGIFASADNQSDYHNSLLQVGGNWQRYDKRQLVPFGEYMPVRWLMRVFSYFVAIPQSDMLQGAPQQAPFLLETRDGTAYKVGAQICYESAYPDVIAANARDAAILVNVSNDAWFGNSLAPHQHLEITRVRAAEFARAIARATNTGISALIDPVGNVLHQSRQFVASSMRAPLPLNREPSVFSQIGQRNIGIILSLILIIIFFITIRQNDNALDN